ncbi:MAG: glycosyltransferase family 4 protein [Butyrivibrio sp.]|nr:glycosyltransferase family 4 protein [Butyrivibrio sp.]
MKNENTDNLRKKHIAMYIGSLNKGGAERVMCNLAEYFKKRGFRVTMVTTYLADDEYEVAGANWIREDDFAKNGDALNEGYHALDVLSPEDVPRRVYVKKSEDTGINRVFSALMPDERKGRVSNFIGRVGKLRAIWKALEPDLILSFLGKNNVMAIYSARGLGIPVVVSVRSNPSREYAAKGLNMAMNVLFKRAAGVVVQTTGARDYFKESIRKKCVILPNSVHQSFMNEEITEFEDREKTIVSVGRLDDNKNQILLIRAFGKIMDKHPEYRLVLYGDGPSRKKFESAADSLMRDVSNGAITFMGNASDIPAKIKSAGIFVLSSKQEGMPNALIEAMSLGIACVSTDCPCGGPRDLINNNENGILIPMGSDEEMTDALADALLKLTEDNDFRKKLSENALEVRKLYSPDRINGLWEEYFNKLMK